MHSQVIYDISDICIAETTATPENAASSDME